MSGLKTLSLLVLGLFVVAGCQEEIPKGTGNPRSMPDMSAGAAAVEGAAEGAKEAVEGAVEGAAEGAKEAVEGAADGAKEAVEGAVEGAKEAVEGATGN